MAYKVRLAKRVIKFLKKQKDQQLKKKCLNVIYDEIANHPDKGLAKRGDLSEFFTQGFRYAQVTYRMAYTIDDVGDIVVIFLAGSHENFYEELKRVLAR
ncbi:type II toxin-antitoxin system RelE/ParE family toxin [Levilactobacillus acidifarinae]|uniref:type II toxin-antitoxin system RelE/ParE family toxin n=1 Tax=Levilactobacillus acidifarinae TaxID=267364 RepID=UPI00070EBECD|nr:type II toxin-antitoxin system RelE/ParE family toxin [Levilactobacillus acidifarinae]GEO69884.1 addiction module toxin RelE [Levilactobacillus acidifarinae]